MTSWALWDRLQPVVAVIAASLLSYRLGRAHERVDRLLAEVRRRERPSRRTAS